MAVVYIRTTDAIHDALQSEAQYLGVSLSTYVNLVLQGKISRSEGVPSGS